MTQEIAKTETVNTNGVNVNALFETIEAVKNDHELAKFKFRAKIIGLVVATTNPPSRSFMVAKQKIRTALSPLCSMP
ncbi:hypothetical protein [Nitrosomonas communis]|uniref:Uncharacterized protein n=1 Tax=Nitrosomonas communis TaxID=44574 RepID=A0A1I4LBN8_9PROT|nr:hypothetical protein [Nitrosomonas communis]SFL88193.1 hypothetical protein SAMN05421863_100652 [Nitrosomonas communis]